MQTAALNQLLVAYDGSACADGAMEDLALAGLPERGEARVLSVADVWIPPVSHAGAPGSSPAVQRARQEAKTAVAEALKLAERGAERLRRLLPQWRVVAESRGDSPAWAVLKEAGDWPADLLLVGSHGRSLLERLFLGSVSQKILAEAPCSVRIGRAPRPTADAPRIVIAVDGSTDSEAAVQAVVGRRWAPAARFRLATVIDPRMQTAVAWPSVYADQWVRQRDQEAREWVCRVVEHYAGTLTAAGLQVETDIFESDPRSALLGLVDSWQATSLFLGARGLHHGGRQFLGTTAAALASRAACSVEVVRSR